VGPSIGGSDVPRKHMALVHADAYRKGRVGVHDGRQAEQHPAVVVTEGGRGARHQDDLASIVIDVGAEERDAVRLRGSLCTGHQLVQSGREDVDAMRYDKLVDAVEVDEGYRRGPVL